MSRFDQNHFHRPPGRVTIQVNGWAALAWLGYAIALGSVAWYFL